MGYRTKAGQTALSFDFYPGLSLREIRFVGNKMAADEPPNEKGGFRLLLVRWFSIRPRSSSSHRLFCYSLGRE